MYKKVKFTGGFRKFSSPTVVIRFLGIWAMRGRLGLRGHHVIRIPVVLATILSLLAVGIASLLPVGIAQAAVDVRKNVAALTANEKTELVEAFLALKDNTKYDGYVKTHRDNYNAAHTTTATPNPAFLPWHRQFMKQIQADIKALPGNATTGNPLNKVILPYWDWTDINQRTEDKIPWTTNFMGKDGTGDADSNGTVDMGANSHDVVLPQSDNFHKIKWPVKHNDPAIAGEDGATPTLRPLRRNIKFGQSIVPGTGGIEEVLTKLEAAMGDAAYGGFNENLESDLHNPVHVWVCNDGGDMNTAVAPNDPIFSLNHVMVDRVWASWQLRGAGRLDEYDGNKTDELAGLGGAKVEDVLNFTTMYTYDTFIIPEPSAVWLFGSGLLALMGVARRSHKRDRREWH